MHIAHSKRMKFLEKNPQFFFSKSDFQSYSKGLKENFLRKNQEKKIVKRIWMIFTEKNCEKKTREKFGKK